MIDLKFWLSVSGFVFLFLLPLFLVAWMMTTVDKAPKRKKGN